MSSIISDSKREKCGETFVHVMTQFLEQLATVFPDCPKIGLFNTLWNEKLEKEGTPISKTFYTEAVEEYHSQFSEVYELCLSKDTSVLEMDISFIKNIDLDKKYREGLIHPKSQEAIWAFVNSLNRFANLYINGEDLKKNVDHAPPVSQEASPSTFEEKTEEDEDEEDNPLQRVFNGILKSSQQVSRDIIQKQGNSGEAASASEIMGNVDIISATQSVLGSLDQNDIMELANGFSSGKHNIMDVMSLFSKSVTNIKEMMEKDHLD